MVEAASARGYRGATVSRVVELAGVSRATFYEHFSGREDCFLAAYRLKVDEVGAALRAAAGAGGQRDLPAAVLDVLLAALAADPAGARLVLLEALATPAATRAEHEDLIAEVERLTAGFLDEQAAVAIQIPAAALFVGVGHVLGARVLARAAGDLPRLLADLSRWIDAYRLPDGVPPLPQRRWRELGRFAKLVEPDAGAELSLLPRGRSALPADIAAQARRERLLDATARVAAEGGYSSLTVERIAAAARVPRTAFYSHFEGKDEAFLAAQTHGLQGAIAVAAAEYSPAAPWPRRVWKAVGALLEYVGENPDYARLDFVESFAAGPAAIDNRHENQMVFALFLEDGYRQSPQAGDLPRVCSEAIAGAVFGLMRSLVIEERTERMLSLRPAVVYTILAPFIGPGEAVDLVQAWARGAR
jgi:AcrR family transcriptional regulator